MKRTTYKDCIQKIQLRNMLFSNLKFDKVIGLGGPDITDYIKFLRNKGLKNIEVWENNRETFLIQISKIYDLRFNLNFGDINSIDYQEGILYDLDYCCTIKSVKEIAKFKDNFIMTFALKDTCNQLETMRLFLEYRNEECNKLTFFNGGFSVMTTENKRYTFYKYRSGSKANTGTYMIVITSL